MEGKLHIILYFREDCERSFKNCQKYIKTIEIPVPTKTQEPEIVVPDGPIKKYYVASEDISIPIYSSKESSETMLGTYELMEALMILKILKF